MIDIDPKALVFSIINFLGIIFVLNFILYKPIRQILYLEKVVA